MTASKPQQGYRAVVTQEGLVYRARVFYSHPFGLVIHYSGVFWPFMLAKAVASIMAICKVYGLLREHNPKTWSKYYGE
jgi:hypothetical protein